VNSKCIDHEHILGRCAFAEPFPLANRLSTSVEEAPMRVIQALLIVVLLVLVAFFTLGWWYGGTPRQVDIGTDRATGTAGRIDVEAARERGAELGEKAAVAAAKIEETVEETGITAKIKAKMALDDYVKARTINVTTNGSTVTLSGRVETIAERQRALRIAGDTAGVGRVVDRLQIR
jgi:hypothetical protein